MQGRKPLTSASHLSREVDPRAISPHTGRRELKKLLKKTLLKKIQGHSYFSNAELRAHNWSEAE